MRYFPLIPYKLFMIDQDEINRNVNDILNRNRAMEKQEKYLNEIAEFLERRAIELEALDLKKSNLDLERTLLELQIANGISNCKWKRHGWKE
jgi:hypothetical protein